MTSTRDVRNYYCALEISIVERCWRVGVLILRRQIEMHREWVVEALMGRLASFVECEIIPIRFHVGMLTYQNVFRYYCTVWTFVQSVLLTIVLLISCRLACLWNSLKLVRWMLYIGLHLYFTNNGSKNIKNECCEMFNIRSVSSLILNRKQNFLT